MRTDGRRAKIFLLISILLLATAVAGILFLARRAEKQKYRLQYPTLIRECAQDYALDPYLVAAIIHTESSNRPDAVSPSGAIGLMQVMPETGEWIAGKLKTPDYTVDLLYSPEINIRLGCWYLRFLLDRYEQDTLLAAAAYNAGQGTVDKWLRDPAVSSGNTLANIPYPETEKYVEKVQHAHEKYKTLYKDYF